MTAERWPSAKAILDVFDARQSPDGTVLRTAAELRETNAELWRQEDEIRMVSLPPESVAALRATIQDLNSRRNQIIEHLNDAFSDVVSCDPLALPMTEAIGSAIDRLSIVVLRRYHLRHRATVAAIDSERLAIVEAQLSDLVAAIDLMVEDVASGRRRLPAFSTAKMYGPPLRS